MIALVVCIADLSIIDLSWADENEAWTEIEKKGGNETWAGIFGNLGLLFFLIGNVYTPAKLLSTGNPALKEKLSEFLKFHVIFNVAAFACICLHALMAEAMNIPLIISLFLLIWLIVGGSMLKSQSGPGMKRSLHLLHTQQALFGIMILLLIIGHGVVD